MKPGRRGMGFTSTGMIKDSLTVKVTKEGGGGGSSAGPWGLGGWEVI